MLSTYTHKERNAPTMHPTKRQFVLSSVIPLFRFAPTVVLLRNQHGLQITKILFITNLLASRPTRTWSNFCRKYCSCISLLFPAISILLFYSCRGTKRSNRSLCVAFCTLTNPKDCTICRRAKESSVLQETPQNPSFSFRLLIHSGIPWESWLDFRFPKTPREPNLWFIMPIELGIFINPWV